MTTHSTNPSGRRVRGGARVGIGLALASVMTLAVGLPLGSVSASAAAPPVSQNDESNTVTGLTAEHMWTADYQGPYRDNHWQRVVPGTTFPGTQRVVVAALNEVALSTPMWDAATEYPQGSVVQSGERLHTAKWWVTGTSPGASSGPREYPWAFGPWIDIEILGDFQFTPMSGRQATSYQRDQQRDERIGTRVVGYFPEWGVYDAHDNYGVDDVPFEEITHLNYAFGALKESAPGAGDWTLQTFDEGAALGKDGLYRQVAEATARHGVRNVLSVGGWNNSVDAQWQDATRTPEQRERLSVGIVDFMLEHGFTALDVDWEYPSSPADADQFEDLIVRLRTLLTEHGLKDDAYYPLSIAVTPNHTKMEFIRPEVIVEHVDSVNVMSYDFHGAFDPVTGHNAPLYAGSLVEDQKLDVESAMDEMHTVWGVPKARLLAGVGFYGRGWGDVEPTELLPGLPGLGAPGTATVKGQWDDEGEATGTNPWYTLRALESDPRFTKYRDPEAKVPYLYSSTTGEFFTYDDPESIQHKVDFIRENEYGGAIIWELSGDSDAHELSSIVGSLLDDVTVASPKLHVRNNVSSVTVSLTMPTADFAEMPRHIVSVGGTDVFEIRRGQARSATVTQSGQDTTVTAHLSGWTGQQPVTLDRTTGDLGAPTGTRDEVAWHIAHFVPRILPWEREAVRQLTWADGTITASLAASQFNGNYRFVLAVNGAYVAETFQGQAHGATATTDGDLVHVTAPMDLVRGDVVEVRLTDLTPGETVEFYQTLASYTVPELQAAGVPYSATSTTRMPSGRVLGDGTATHTLSVTLKDPNGDPVTGLTGAKFPAEITVAGIDAQVGAFKESGSGMYYAYVTSTQPGTATVTVSLNDTVIGAPVTADFSEYVPGTVERSRSSIRVTSTTPALPDGKQRHIVQVVLKDASGKAVTGQAPQLPIDVTFDELVGTTYRATDKLTTNAWREASTKGTYELFVTSTTAGTFAVHGHLDGSRLPMGTTVFTFGQAPTGVVDVARSSSRIAAGVKLGDGAATHTVSVTLKDADDNPVTGLAGSKFPATTTLGGSGAKIGQFIESGAKGTYYAYITSTRPGAVSVDVALDGKAIGGTNTAEFSEYVPGLADRSASYIRVLTGSRLANGRDEHTVSVTLKDAAGKAVTGKSRAAMPVTLTISGPPDVPASAVRTTPFVETPVQGTYVARVTSTTVGDFYASGHLGTSRIGMLNTGMSFLDSKVG